MDNTIVIDGELNLILSLEEAPVLSLTESGELENVIKVVERDTPSATQHTIYFEFSDNTNTTIDAYYDDSFISNAITATTPITYGGKTVTLAQLDGVTWYTRPAETWETIYNAITNFNPDSDPTVPPYCWISELGDVTITVGSVWRVTFNGVEYRLTAFPTPSYTDHGAIGNTRYLPGDGIDDGSGVPFGLYHTPWGAWSGAADLQPYTQSSSVSIKIERLVTA